MFSNCYAESVGTVIEVRGTTFEALPQEYVAPIKELVGNIDNKFTIAAFVEDNCPTCEIGLALFRDFARMYPDLITMVVYDKKDKNKFPDKFDIDFYPSFIFLDANGKNRGVKFIGTPKGYSLNTVVSAIKLFGSGKADITPAQRDLIKKITESSLVEVIVTPGCPHCPKASIVANSVAYENDHIEVRTIDATQHTEIARRYRISAVPVVIYNGRAKEIGVNQIETIVQNLLE